MAESMDTQY